MKTITILRKIFFPTPTEKVIKLLLDNQYSGQSREKAYIAAFKIVEDNNIPVYWGWNGHTSSPINGVSGTKGRGPIKKREILPYREKFLIFDKNTNSFFSLWHFLHYDISVLRITKYLSEDYTQTKEEILSSSRELDLAIQKQEKQRELAKNVRLNEERYISKFLQAC